jgi:glycosyltransferase involved in cell wall biosynthesis
VTPGQPTRGREPLRALVVTNMPSYHQVDLFNALARMDGLQLQVLYLRRITPGRQWKTLQAIHHPHQFVPEWRLNASFYLNPGTLRSVRAFRPHVLVVTQYASIAMQALMYWASAVRLPWVFWTERPGVEWTELPIVKGERLRRALRAVALIPLSLGPKEIWGIGERASADLADRTGRSVSNVPYGSDLSPLRAIERVPPRRPLRFLYAGKLVERKGIDVLVQATDQLLRAGAEFELRVAGDGPLAPVLEPLERAWPGAVRRLGFLELAEVPAAMAEADVLVCPSRYDGWGMVVPEAMASGMPVIATDTTGAALELLRPGLNGWMAVAGDADSLAGCMRAALTAFDRIPEMGERARADVAGVEARAVAAQIRSRLEAIVPATE